ncbi:MAG: hypothetical protein WEH44_06575, partial [Pirellulaceae bacterium]
RLYPNEVSISARTQQGLELLNKKVSEALSRSFLDLDVETGVGNGRMLALLAAHGEVLSRHFFDDRVVVHVRLPARHAGLLHEPGTIIRTHEAAPPSARDSAAEEHPLSTATSDVA